MRCGDCNHLPSHRKDARRVNDDTAVQALAVVVLPNLEHAAEHAQPRHVQLRKGEAAQIVNLRLPLVGACNLVAQAQLHPVDVVGAELVLADLLHQRARVNLAQPHHVDGLAIVQLYIRAWPIPSHLGAHSRVDWHQGRDSVCSKFQRLAQHFHRRFQLELSSHKKAFQSERRTAERRDHFATRRAVDVGRHLVSKLDRERRRHGDMQRVRRRLRLLRLVGYCGHRDITRPTAINHVGRGGGEAPRSEDQSDVCRRAVLVL